MTVLDNIEKMQKNVENMINTSDISSFFQITGESPLTQQLEILKEISADTKSLETQTLELKRIADAADLSAKLAEEKAKSAKNDAKISKRQSYIANILAVIAIIIAITAWLIPRDVVSHFFLSIIP